MTQSDIAFDDRKVLIGVGYLSSAIDDLCIYDRKLSDFEIQKLGPLAFYRRPVGS